MLNVVITESKIGPIKPIGVTDEQLIDGIEALAETVGVWPEPSSAAVVSALAELADRGQLHADDDVVLTITGSGHKHTEPIEGRFDPVPVVSYEPDAIADAFD